MHLHSLPLTQTFHSLCYQKSHMQFHVVGQSSKSVSYGKPLRLRRLFQVVAVRSLQWIEKKAVDSAVEKGMIHNQRIVMKGAGDQQVSIGQGGTKLPSIVTAVGI